MPSANARWYKVGDALLVLSEGDITQWSGDAVVNAGVWCKDAARHHMLTTCSRWVLSAPSSN